MLCCGDFVACTSEDMTTCNMNFRNASWNNLKASFWEKVVWRDINGGLIIIQLKVIEHGCGRTTVLVLVIEIVIE